MHRDKPFFSILVPSYNRPGELKRCVDSILQSSFDNFEIIISDDNSPLREEIAEMMIEFSENPQVLFFQQESNLKEPGNKNFLTSKAAGDFNIIVGDDDVINVDTLRSIYDFITKKPGYDIYGMGYCIVDEYNVPISIHVSPKASVLTSKANIKYLFEFGVSPMSFMHPATFCCRSGIELSIPYRSDVGIGEDLCFLLQAAARGHSLVTIPQALFNWRKVQDASAVLQNNQSAEHLASFKAKSLIYGVLKQESFNNKRLEEYVYSPIFRFRFLYMEILRDPVIGALTQADLAIEKGMYGELNQHRRSLFTKVRVRARRLISFLEVCKMLGLSMAVKWVVTAVKFRRQWARGD